MSHDKAKELGLVDFIFLHILFSFSMLDQMRKESKKKRERKKKKLLLAVNAFWIYLLNC